MSNQPVFPVLRDMFSKENMDVSVCGVARTRSYPTRISSSKSKENLTRRPSRAPFTQRTNTLHVDRVSRASSTAIKATTDGPRPFNLSMRGVAAPTLRARLPPELVEKIVSYLLIDFFELTSDHGLLTSITSSRFAPVDSFSSACYQFRQIAIRCYLECLELVTAKQLESTVLLLKAQHHWPRCTLARELYVASHVLHLIQNIHHTTLCDLFPNLTVLLTDFSHENLNTQRKHTKTLFNLSACTSKPCSVLSEPQPCTHCPAFAQLTNLEICALPRIEENLLETVSRACPSLTRLWLGCSERLEPRCCWVCYEDSASCTNHSPVGTMYVKPHLMAAAFGRALQSLAQLKHLKLGIFVSDADMLADHIDHHWGLTNVNLLTIPTLDDHLAEISRLEVAKVEMHEFNWRNFDFDHSTPRTCTTPYAEQARSLLTLESFVTTSVLLDDDGVLPVHDPCECVWCYVEHAHRVRLEEMMCSMILAMSVTNLDTISWNTYFPRVKLDSEGSGYSNKMSTMWVKRTSDMIGVSREPYQ